MPRQKGAIGKNKQFLLNRLKDQFGEEFDPVMRMAANCAALDKIAAETLAHAEKRLQQKRLSHQDRRDILNNARATLMDANEAWNKVAAYVTPKMKSIEVVGDEDRPVGVVTKIERVIVDPQKDAHVDSAP